MQRGDPWIKKNSKCSNLDETCRTGRGHHKNKLGSDFEVFLHLVALWGIKKESGHYAKSRFWPATPSKVHQTCRTGREVFWKCFCNSVVHCRRWKKSEIGQKCSRRNHQKWRVFFKIAFFCNQKWRIRNLFWTKSSVLRRNCMTVTCAWHDGEECMTVTKTTTTIKKKNVPK